MVILENTPITKLSVPGNSFYIKRDDLLPFSCGGNKVRIAYEFLEDMKAKGGNCLIMYGNSRSNLCRVLASACYMEGIPCMMICSDDPDGVHRKTKNSVLVGLLGLEVIYCAKNAIAPAVDEAFRRAVSRGLIPYYIYGNRFGTGNEGCAARAYARAYDEICAQEKAMGIRFDYIFHASGTGATQSGLVCGHLVRGDDRKIVGISVSRDKERGTGIIKCTCVSLNDAPGSPACDCASCLCIVIVTFGSSFCRFVIVQLSSEPLQLTRYREVSPVFASSGSTVTDSSPILISDTS